jgi:hypothetical protein
MQLAFLAGVLSVIGAGSPVRAADEADIKPDLTALEGRFKVVKHRFDSAKRRYVLILEARTTSDKACHFDASFQDPDDKEITSVKLEFEDGGKQTQKGEKYTATVKYPTRKTMEKVTQIVIKKSD